MASMRVSFEERKCRMTGDQSRQLKVGTRVWLSGDKADRGTVIDKDWSAVQIKWESGKTQSFHHNDMAMVAEQALMKPPVERDR